MCLVEVDKYIFTIFVCILCIIDSVQTSLEAKFSGGRQGTIPVTPSPEFHSRMGVSSPALSRTVVGCDCARFVWAIQCWYIRLCLAYFIGCF